MHVTVTSPPSGLRLPQANPQANLRLLSVEIAMGFSQKFVKTHVFWSTQQCRDLVRKVLDRYPEFGLHQKAIYEEIHKRWPDLKAEAQPRKMIPGAILPGGVMPPPVSDHPIRSIKWVNI